MLLNGNNQAIITIYINGEGIIDRRGGNIDKHLCNTIKILLVLIFPNIQ